MSKYFKKEDYRAIISFTPEIRDAFKSALKSPVMARREYSQKTFSYLQLLLEDKLQQASISSTEIDNWFKFINKHDDFLSAYAFNSTNPIRKWWVDKDCVQAWRRTYPVSAIPNYIGFPKSDNIPKRSLSYQTVAYQSNIYRQALKWLNDGYNNPEHLNIIKDLFKQAQDTKYNTHVVFNLLTPLENELTPSDADYHAFLCVFESIYTYKMRGKGCDWSSYDWHNDQEICTDALQISNRELHELKSGVKFADLLETCGVYAEQHLKDATPDELCQFYTSCCLIAFNSDKIFFNVAYDASVRKYSRGMASLNKVINFWTPLIQSMVIMHDFVSDFYKDGIDDIVYSDSVFNGAKHFHEDYLEIIENVPLFSCINELLNNTSDLIPNSESRTSLLKLMIHTFKWGDTPSNFRWDNHQFMWPSYNNDLEELSNAFYTEITPSTLHMKIVRGEDIRKYYSADSYLPGTPRGSLWGSCMRNESNQPAIEFFVTCGAEMLVLLDRQEVTSDYPDGMVIGRAILWNVVRVTPHYRRQKSKSNYYIKMMDRIYYSHDWVTSMFLKYAQENGYNTKANQSYDTPLGVMDTDGKSANLHMQVCLPHEFKVNMCSGFPYMDTFSEIDIGNNLLCNHKPGSFYNTPEDNLDDERIYEGERNLILRYMEVDNSDGFVGLPIINRMSFDYGLYAQSSDTIIPIRKKHIWTLRATNNGVSSMWDFYSGDYSSNRRFTSDYGWMCDFKSAVVSQKVLVDGNVEIRTKTIPTSHTIYSGFTGTYVAKKIMKNGKIKVIKPNWVTVVRHKDGRTESVPSVLTNKCAYFSSLPITEDGQELFVGVTSIQSGLNVIIGSKKYRLSQLALQFFSRYAFEDYKTIREYVHNEMEQGVASKENVRNIPKTCQTPFQVMHDGLDELVPLTSRRLIYSDYHQAYLLDFDAIRIDTLKSVVSKGLMGVRKSRKLIKINEELNKFHKSLSVKKVKQSLKLN